MPKGLEETSLQLADNLMGIALVFQDWVQVAHRLGPACNYAYVLWDAHHTCQEFKAPEQFVAEGFSC